MQKLSKSVEVCVGFSGKPNMLQFFETQVDADGTSRFVVSPKLTETACCVMGDDMKTF